MIVPFQSSAMKKIYFLILHSLFLFLLFVCFYATGQVYAQTGSKDRQPYKLYSDSQARASQHPSILNTGILCSPVYLDSIQVFQPGRMHDGSAIPKERQDPRKVLGTEGTPQPLSNCFVSLGFDAGYIIASFAAPVKDSIVVWEGSFPKNELLLETADVFGSLDGTTYTFLGEANNRINFKTDSIHPTTIRLPFPVKFIKVVNTTPRSDPNQRAIDDGFDLDAIGASSFAPEYLLSALGSLSSCETKKVILSAPRGYLYQWIKDGIPVSGIVGYADTAVVTPGLYQVRIINEGGCSITSDPLQLSPEPLPVAGLSPGGTTEVCGEAEIKLTASGGKNYQWLLNGKIISGVVSKIDTLIKTAGSYQVIAINAQGCKDTSAAFTLKILTQPAKPTASANTESCIGGSIMLKASAANKDASFVWTGPAGFTSTSPNPVINNATTAHSGTYEVRTVLNGCTSETAKVEVVVKPPFTVNLGPDRSVCEGKTLMLDAGINGATYTWNTGETSRAIQVKKAGKYYVEVLQPGGCSSSDTIQIAELKAPTVKASPLEEICGNQPVFLRADISGDRVRAEWNTTGQGSFSQADAPSTYYYPAEGEAGKVTFYVTATNECSSEVDSVAVQINDYASADFTTSPKEPFVGMPVTFYISHPRSNTSYRWDFGNGQTSQELQPTITFDDPGTFKVTLIASQDTSCPDSSSEDIIVASTHILYIPNIFSPTASHPDNKNLKVFGTNIQATDFSFMIFNRWGQVVYQTNSFEQANQVGWNGGLLNSVEEQPVGVYTWTVKGKFADGTPFSKTGTATLIR